MLNHNYEQITKEIRHLLYYRNNVQKVLGNSNEQKYTELYSIKKGACNYLGTRFLSYSKEKQLDLMTREVRLAANCRKRLGLYDTKLATAYEVLAKLDHMGMTPYRKNYSSFKTSATDDMTNALRYSMGTIINYNGPWTAEAEL